MDPETGLGMAIDPDEPLPSWCQPQWEMLAARVDGGTLPHALSLGGAAGLGKRALAQTLVRRCLCESPAGSQACGACRACRLLAAGTHPDYIRVTLVPHPKTGVMRKEIVVEQVRTLSARLALASQRDGWQVAVIDPAEGMNTAAQNALLKTLEEPTDSSLIVLVADQPWRLIATIRSRCQRLDFKLPARHQALAWLSARGVAHAENALQVAGGNPGQAWSMAECGGLQRRQDVARGLLALAAGRGDARALSKAWAEDEPEQRLEQAARLFAGALHARALGSRARFDPGWDGSVLIAAFASANRLRSLLRGPLRANLALFEWLNGLPGG
jgi:DNA polymerase-3 subunit delta'